MYTLDEILNIFGQIKVRILTKNLSIEILSKLRGDKYSKNICKANVDDKLYQSSHGV